MNDTIWLSLTADEKIPMAAKAEAKKNKPMYDPRIAPESRFPLGAPN